MDSYGRRSRSPGPRGENSWTYREDRNGNGMDPYRRRSPDRRRNGRVRSRSPSHHQIDRYQPGARKGRAEDGPPPSGGRRDDSHRRRSPGPSQNLIDRYVPGQEPPAAPVVNPLPHPLTLDYQVGFNWFAEWWRKDQEVRDERERQKTGARRPPERLKGEKESREERDKERSLIQAAYDAYKEKLQVQMSRMFVQQHKAEEWFKERYDPDVRDPFRTRQAEFRKGAYRQWESDLDQGAFDEFTLEGIYKAESNGAGGTVEKEEGETIAAAEVLGVGDLLPSKGGDIKDEASLQPALLIKTIAPHVSRDRMENFCREHLGDGDGGFQWLSLSDPNPSKKCHRIGWVMLNPGGDVTIEVNKGEDRRDERDEEAEDGEDGMDAMETITQSATEKALGALNSKSIVDEERGNFTVHVGIHVPTNSARKKALWDLFSAPERVERDLELALRLVSKYEQELGEDFSGMAKIEERVEELRSRGALHAITSAQAPRKSKAHKDSDIEDAEEGEEDGDEEEEGAWDEEVDDENLLVQKKKLDLLVEYLRRVYNFCFFCVFESDSVHELTRKCPGGHLRRPRASLTSSAKAVAKASALGEAFPLKRQETKDTEQQGDNEAGSPVLEKKFNKANKTHHQLQRAFNWVKTYEDKLFQILDPESVDLHKLGGRPLEEALDEELKKFVKQEDEAKFRCKVPGCIKLFKGEPFWRKHVEKRHEEWFAALIKDLELINRYVLDPAHITPSRTDATSNGHFPSNTHAPTGTPRGFNLQQMPYGAMPPNMMSGPGMPGPPHHGYPPAFGGYPMAVPGPFGPPAQFGVDPSGHVGPMRRGPGRYNNFHANRMGNPYDRQPKDARNMRWGVGAGAGAGAGAGFPMAGDPMRANGRMGMAGFPGAGGPMRFADGAMGMGGVGMMGPREAVAGRSLKSYEDLDAVDNSGNGELNY